MSRQETSIPVKVRRLSQDVEACGGAEQNHLSCHQTNTVHSIWIKFGMDILLGTYYWIVARHKKNLVIFRPKFFVGGRNFFYNFFLVPITKNGQNERFSRFKNVFMPYFLKELLYMVILSHYRCL
jgi:hypothetical protein